MKLLPEKKRDAFYEERKKAYDEEYQRLGKEKAIEEGKALARKRLNHKSMPVSVLEGMGKAMGTLVQPQSNNQKPKPSLLRNIAESSMDFVETGDFSRQDRQVLHDSNTRKKGRKKRQYNIDDTDAATTANILFGSLESL